MNADLIARCVILVIISTIAMVEYYFVRNAVIAEAEIIGKVSHIRDSTSHVKPKATDVVVSQRLQVRLDPAETDGRIGHVSVRETVFESVSSGDRISVMCLAHKPAWIFWTSLIRDRALIEKWNHFLVALGFVAAASVFVVWYFFL